MAWTCLYFLYVPVLFEDTCILGLNMFFPKIGFYEANFIVTEESIEY